MALYTPYHTKLMVTDEFERREKEHFPQIRKLLEPAEGDLLENNGTHAQQISAQEVQKKESKQYAPMRHIQ